MFKAIGVAVVLIGGVLLFYGFKERDSLQSQFKEIVTGSPTDRSVMMMAGGGGLVALGLGLLVFGKK